MALAYARKTIYGFRQGKVSARRYIAEQNKLKNRLSRGLQKKLETSLNKSVRIVAQVIKEGGDPSIGVIITSLSEEVDAVLKRQIRRTFQTVYDYNDEKYSKISQKADYEGDGGFNFGRSARFEADVTDYFNTRKPFFDNLAQNQGRHILLEVHNLRTSDNNLDQIARKLTKQFKSINRNRAAVIARTETHSAQSFANNKYHRKVSDSFGVQMVKKWVSTADARTRRNHSMMNGETAQMDEDFLMPDGARMGYAGDPRGGPNNVINCRCVILYVDDEDDAVDDRPVSNTVDGKEIELENLVNQAGDDVLGAEYMNPETGVVHSTYIFEKQGYDALPKLVSSSKFSEIRGRTYYRGIKPRQVGGEARNAPSDLTYVNNLKKGKYYAGEGLSGNGTYSAYGDEGLEVARNFASRTRGLADLDANVVVFKLSDQAKIIKFKDLEIMRRNNKSLERLIEAYDAKIVVLEGRLKTGKITNDVFGRELKKIENKKILAERIHEDPAAFAARLGYDAIDHESQKYMIILNRTAMIIENKP